MKEWVRQHVLLSTAALTVVALGLVFGAVGGVIPSSVLPRAPDSVLAAIPHLNAAISLAAVATIGLGWRAIGRGDVVRHRRLMLASFALFASFLVLYLYRLIHVGTKSFPGPETVELFVYIPFLTVHILLAIACLPFVFYALLLAWTHSVTELYHTRHAQAGFVAATLWQVSFLLGIGVYVMLHHLF